MPTECVRFDAEGARLMLALLERLAAGEEVPEAVVQALLETPAYRLFFAHHNRFVNRGLAPAEFAAMLRAVPRGEFASENPQLQTMWSRFREAPARLAELQALYDEVATGEAMPQAAQLARRWLPEGAALDTTVFVLLDGMSGGFVYQGQVAFDLLQMTGAGRFMQVLAHELHHIGVEGLWQGQFEAPHLAPGQHLALEFVGLLLGEGSATRLISGAPEEPEGVAQWQGHMAHLDALFARAEDLLRRTWAGEIDEATFQAEVPSFLQGYMGEAYAVGYVMVERILAALGSAAVLACLREPRRTLAVYNEAAARTPGAYRFDEGLAGAVAGL
ncbi:MAG TPA: hypothetical protein PLJ35_15185 [Anaerolineae bacterium]|nr:hypothetical protein [Anaerolineae bacterium]